MRALPLQADRKLESLRAALDSEDRRRKTVKHTDGDGQRIEDVVLAASSDNTIRHRLGRKPRHVEVVGLPVTDFKFTIRDRTTWTDQEFKIYNGSAFPVTVTIWVY